MLRSVLFTFLRVIFLLLGGARELVSSMLSTLGLQDCSLYFPACNLFLLTGTQELIASIFPSLGLQDSSLPSPSRKVPKRHKGRPCTNDTKVAHVVYLVPSLVCAALMKSRPLLSFLVAPDEIPPTCPCTKMVCLS